MPQTLNIGRKISKIRDLRGIKQDHLAMELGISQQAISRIEQSESVDDETLEKIAKVLGVPSEAIKNFSDEAAIYNIQNNYEGSNNGVTTVSAMNYHCSFNPLDKVIELYERLLQAEKEKNDLLKGK